LNTPPLPSSTDAQETPITTQTIRPPAPAAGERNWLTVDQVLEELSIPRRTWQRWRELGTGPQCVRLPNRELRIHRSTFTEWLENLEEAA
jgi:hypothetical protein